MYVASTGEPPVLKKSSWKALSSLTIVQTSDTAFAGGTNIILYFKKDGGRAPPPYGSKVAFRKEPDSIKNFIAGSAFDYQRYCALKNIHYQVFLKADEYVVLGGKNRNAFHADAVQHSALGNQSITH